MSSRAGPHRVRFADRLLAEAVAAGERRDGRARRDADAEAAALESPPEFESRIIARARALPDAGELTDSTRRVRTVVTLVIAMALILGALAGAASGRAALASPREPVNFFLVMLGLLGVQSVLLVLWFVVFVLGPRFLRRGSLGGLLMRSAQALTRRFLPQKKHVAAMDAYGRLTLRGRAGAWLISGVSHQVWAMFNIGCLTMIVVLLSTNQYNFVWETTTRTEDQYVALTKAIAAWPERLGFDVPTETQIRVSRHVKGESDALDVAMPPTAVTPSVDERDRQIAWAGLLIGCLVTYGLAPRLLLGLVCAMGGWLARRRTRLDVDAPEYALLRPILLPAASQLDDSPSQSPEKTDAPMPVRDTSPIDDPRTISGPAIVGLEIDRPACSWPPIVHGMTWDDAGFVDSGADRTQLIESLRSSHTRPSTMVVVCDLPATPDRGIHAFLVALSQASGAPLTVVLTGGHRLRSRSDVKTMSHRIDDWYAVARAAGVADERIVQVDFDHLTDRSIALLRTAVKNKAPAPTERIDDRLGIAFKAIADHALQWNGDPSHDDVLRLHQEIASIYRVQASRTAQFAGGMGALMREAKAGGDIAGTVQNGVRSLIEQLPGRLRSQPKWMAAGAAAGAFGCLALTLSIAPAAIAALPAWTAFGVAVSAGLRLAMPDRGDEAVLTDDSFIQRPDAIRAAALFAVLLDLQGRSETDISRILDLTFRENAGDSPPDLNSPPGAQQWLQVTTARYARAAANGATAP